MSEGGRKVWNREQLLALNSGAIILARWYDHRGQVHPKLVPTEVVRYGGLVTPGGEDEELTFHFFGTELFENGTRNMDEQYPIEVIWEPSDG
jgi:hypothetical protein